MEALKQLNEAQRKAVEHGTGPMVVIAGAGSGKTKALTHRIAYLISNGADPFRILALTFTNKAAREMKERIAQIVGDSDAKNIWMGTFHSVFARFLRAESEKLGFPKDFSIYDTTDSKSLIKRIVKDKGLDPKTYKHGLVYNRISNAKNSLVSPQAYLKDEEIQEDDHMSGRPKLGEIYQEYDKRLFQAGAMDFDDLLFKTNILFRDFEKVLYKYQNKFDHVLVDEFQDTNHSQYLIVKKLAARHENLCVVGDDAQSIYGFRGANIYNLLNFKKDFPDHSLYKLEQNYRSTDTIVQAANALIRKNEEQFHKEVWTQNESGEKIQLFNTLTDNEEGRRVADHIYEIAEERKASYSDFGVLYRTNAQSRAIEEALRKQNIPYRIYGGLSFYQRKEIKDLLAYFRLTVNHHDEEALKRVINYPKRGIGDSTVDKLIVAASENGTSLWEIAANPQRFGLQVGSGVRNKLLQFTTMIDSFSAMLEAKNAYDLAAHIATQSGILKEHYADKTPEGIARYENIQELLNGIKELVEDDEREGTVYLNDFLMEVALLTDAENDDDEQERVSLMTVHSAKGLEFPYVFLVGLEEDLFPSQMALHSREDLEEERRLFYVGLTRAQKKAFLSYSDSRYKFGQLIHSEPSRFLEELDPAYIEEESGRDKGVPFEEAEKGRSQDNGGQKGNGKAGKEQEKAAEQRKKNLKKVQKGAPPPGGGVQEDLEVGTEVEHSRFGKGKVVALEGKSPDTKATVYFPQVGNKQLLLKFARLKILDRP